jgi:hypothetical protein
LAFSRTHDVERGGRLSVSFHQMAMLGLDVPTHQGKTMLPATVADAHRDGVNVVPKSYPGLSQKDRLIEALGSVSYIPRVGEEPLSRYYKYLSARLSFPFTAYYPEPTNTLEEVLHGCIVVELLDPVNGICHEFGGIFCRARMSNNETNLPLIELEIPQDSPNFQLIEDYWYWFWNWR